MKYFSLTSFASVTGEKTQTVMARGKVYTQSDGGGADGHNPNRGGTAGPGRRQLGFDEKSKYVLERLG